VFSASYGLRAVGQILLGPCENCVGSDCQLGEWLKRIRPACCEQWHWREGLLGGALNRCRRGTGFRTGFSGR